MEGARASFTHIFYHTILLLTLRIFDIFLISFERKPHRTTTTTKANASHYYCISFTRGRGGGEGHPPPPIQARPLEGEADIQHERQRRRRERTKRGTSGRRRGELCLHRSGECPGRRDSRPSPPVHQGDSREGILSTITVDWCGTSRRARGDRGGGIFRMQVTSRNVVPPLRRGDQESRIPQLIGVDDCDSQRWTGGDWGVGI